MVFALVEDIHQQGHGIAAAGEARADNHVIDDPDAEGIAVAEIGYRAQPKMNRIKTTTPAASDKTPRNKVKA